MPLMDTFKAYFQSKRLRQLQEGPAPYSQELPSSDAKQGSPAPSEYFGPGPGNTQQALEFLTPAEREAWEKGLPYPKKPTSPSPHTTPRQLHAGSSRSGESHALALLAAPIIYPIGFAALVTVVGSLVYMGMRIHLLLPHWLRATGSAGDIGLGLGILVLGGAVAGGLAGWIISLPFRRAHEVLQIILMGIPCAIVVPLLITMWGFTYVPNALAWILSRVSLFDYMPVAVSRLMQVSYVGSSSLAVVAAGWAMLLVMAKRFDFWPS